MSKIVMRYLMRQYSSKLLIVSFLQQTRRYVELPATRVGGIDAGIINNTDCEASLPGSGPGFGWPKPGFLWMPGAVERTWSPPRNLP